MRTLLIIATLAIAANLASAQAPSTIAKANLRFNVLENPRLFPQTTPKEAVMSLVKAVELEQFDYVVSFLMDEAAVEAGIAERAKLLEAVSDTNLRAVRARQRANPLAYTNDERLPDEPAAFTERVKAQSRILGYQKLSADVRERFIDDPTNAKDLRRFVRDGEVVAQEATAKIAVKETKDRAVYLKKNGNRWTVEDRLIEMAEAK